MVEWDDIDHCQYRYDCVKCGLQWEKFPLDQVVVRDRLVRHPADFVGKGYAEVSLVRPKNKTILGERHHRFVSHWPGYYVTASYKKSKNGYPRWHKIFNPVSTILQCGCCGRFGSSKIVRERDPRKTFLFEWGDPMRDYEPWNKPLCSVCARKLRGFDMANWHLFELSRQARQVNSRWWKFLRGDESPWMYELAEAGQFGDTRKAQDSTSRPNRRI